MDEDRPSRDDAAQPLAAPLAPYTQRNLEPGVGASLIESPFRGEPVDQGKTVPVLISSVGNPRSNGGIAVVGDLSVYLVGAHHDRHGDRPTRTALDRALHQFGDDGGQVPAGLLRKAPEALPNGLTRAKTGVQRGREHEAELIGVRSPRLRLHT